MSLVRTLGPTAAFAVAGRIDTAIAKAASHEVNANLPDIEERIGLGQRPTALDVEDTLNPQEDQKDSVKRRAEAGDAWYERHRHNREAVDKFERELTQAGAELIIQSVTSDLIYEIFKNDPTIVRSWYQRFMLLDASGLGRVHNIASLVAQIIAGDDQKCAIALFGKLTACEPVVRLTFGVAGISLGAVTVWNAGDGDELRNLRFERLDQARTDHDLSNEVLAALNAGKQALLCEYVIDRRGRPEPVHKARAAMVAGLSEDSDWAMETIELLKDAHGFLSRAYEAAKYAMDRHRWSKHWSKMISKATTATNLWRYAVILTTIVDGRFHRSDVEGARTNPLVERYVTSFSSLIRSRIGKWKDKRKKTLFGMDAPDEMFLAGGGSPLGSIRAGPFT